MHYPKLRILAACLAFAAATPALACGEGVFNTGEGLRYQGYLAPRPATVLVYVGQERPSEERIAVYRGLSLAGHHLTVARTPEDISRAMQQHNFDVAIADAGVLELVAEALAPAGVTPRLLPVIERRLRNSPEIRERFAEFVLDDASLGQYLRQINRLAGG